MKNMNARDESRQVILEKLNDQVYKKIGRVTIAKNEMTDNEIEKLVKQINKQRNQFCALVFDGEEPLVNASVMDAVTVDEDIEYELLTAAPKEYWNNQGFLMRFDKIRVLRNYVEDIENNQSVGMITLSEDDYQQMSDEMKNKIIFYIDRKKTNMTLDELENYIQWAHSLGIKKIVFLDNKHSQEWEMFKEARKECMKRKMNAQVKQIEAVRNNNFDPELASKTCNLEVEKPLMQQLMNQLLQAGYHFKSQKAENSPQGFYDIRELSKGNSEVAFKTKCKHCELASTIVFRDIYNIN